MNAPALTQADARGLTQRQRYQQRWEALKTERSTWYSHWQELCDFILPRRGRFLRDAPNKGNKKHGNIINSTATRAARILSSGMHAGITSPARPWFNLTTQDPKLSNFRTVKVWLSLVEDAIRDALLRSNTYNALPLKYRDLAVFGVAATIVDEDEEDILRCYSLPIGQFALANSSRLRIDTMGREFGMTVSQLVEKFGLEAVSARVRDLYQRGNYDAWIDVCHLIQPNRDMKPGKADYSGKPFESCWYELGTGDISKHEGLLRRSGYSEFPVLAPRWDVTGEDVYGNSPGMDALGDIKALQLYEKRSANAIDKMVNPPMKGPASLQRSRVSQLPGDITFVDEMQGGTAFGPSVVVDARAIQFAEEKVVRHEERINAAFMADLWLMLAQSDVRNITAREVAERHEEKVLQLGPVLERLQDELLDPLIDRVFGILLKKGLIPPPPKELQGKELKVEHISVLAQAQKLLGVTAVERGVGFLANLAQTKPSVMDRLNEDKVAEEYFAMLGVKPDLLRTDEEVAAVRKARAELERAEVEAKAMAQGAQAAKALGTTPMDGDTALNRMVEANGSVMPGGGA